MHESFDVVSPVDGQVFTRRAYASSAQIESALTTAAAAQHSWQSSEMNEREELCRGVAEYFRQHADAIGEEISWQMGRPIRYSALEISGGFLERANYMIGIAAETLADTSATRRDGFKRFLRRGPVGTVLVLAPWNYPFLTSVNVIVPAIMAGNSVILKPATQTPLCAERYADAFRAAGAPQGLFQFLHTTHEQVASVIADPRIDYVAFTGSVAGGAAVKRAVGSRFIGCGLELGGKDPAYVRSDANLTHAVDNIVDGAFFNSGQSCCGIERIYVHEARYEEYLSAFVKRVREYVLGNPLDSETTIGPLVRPSAARFVQGQVRDAVEAGAKALVDPVLFPQHLAHSTYLAPQVLIEVDHSMAVMSEETFGPVVGIMPVKNDEEAVALMNDSRYGLTASIWTEDIEAAESIGARIEVGTVYANRCDYLDPELAWTGIKDSGFGYTLSKLGYDALTRNKSFHLRQSPGT
ncbi:MAG: aldehyde dehydrogenase family protein, partial [Rhodothermales bacterium]|nr:aldehyde dehydrogenase family protein [Rhodothermales bacterium]